LDLVEFGGAKAIDGDDLAIRILTELGQMVGDRPPAGADHSYAGFPAQASFPPEIAATGF
jgi:hypothetical protein